MIDDAIEEMCKIISAKYPGAEIKIIDKSLGSHVITETIERDNGDIDIIKISRYQLKKHMQRYKCSVSEIMGTFE